MPHCSSLCCIYPTDLCFLRIPLCPPHLAAHIPMSRHFFVTLTFSDLICHHPNRSYRGTKKIRTHLKNVFWPNLFVGASFLPLRGIPRLILYGLWVKILDPPRVSRRPVPAKF